MMFFLKTLIQFLTFFLLFLATHYWMSREDIFTTITFTEALPFLLIPSTYISLLVVLLIQITSLSNRFFFRGIAFLLALLQVYLNFTYFEYFLVFKTPIFGKDIIYMETPSSVWILAQEAIWNIRFPFFALLPSIAIALTLFPTPWSLHRRFIFEEPRLKVKCGVWILILITGLSLFNYHSTVQDRMGKADQDMVFGYKRNPLIATYEAIANYLQFKEEISKPENLTEIRDIFLDQEKREFTDPKFPLLHKSSPAHKSPSHKNLIVLMLESFPSAEIHALSGNPYFAKVSPFFDQLLPQTLYFPNTYAGGIHTFYGLSDFLVGNSSYQYHSWNKKTTLSLIHSLPALLKRNGYREMAWYHGGRNENFDLMYSFSEKVGFNRRVFYSSFPDDAKKSNWGLTDREVLMRVAQDIRSFQGPFFSFFLGLTKHGPWNTPPDFDSKGFQKDYLALHDGKIPNEGIRNSHRLIYYYNQILEEFFNTLEDHPNFQNSLVIITSDQAFFPDVKGTNFYHNMKNGFNIPLIFYEPGKKTLPIGGDGRNGRNEVFASHLDIIPTLIDYLGLKVPEAVPYEGKNLLNPRHQLHPDAHAHIAFWQDELIHFTSKGLYKLSSKPDQSTVTRFDPSGQEISSPDEKINHMMKTFKSVYPYLMENNMVFPKP